MCSIGMLMLVVVPVEASSCLDAQVNVWENTGFNGHGLAICYNEAIPNFASLSFPGGGNWDNKISSAQFDEKAVNTRACLYDDINYAAIDWSPNSDASIQWFFGGDQVSSFRYVANLTPC